MSVNSEEKLKKSKKDYSTLKVSLILGYVDYLFGISNTI